MTVAQLGLAVDSRQAASAVVDLDALAASAGRAEKSADSMAAGAKRAESASAAMARTIRETVGSNDNATSAINRHVQAIQALTAAESRGGSNSYAQRAADIEAYGRSLDDMRAKINPAYAAIRQYREQVESIRSAHRLGAVSADEMTAAINRERSATLASLAALRERDQAISSARSPGSGYTSNIAAQFQDIGVTAAAGMSPLQIALQQGTQLSAVFTDLRAQGQSVGSTLASAFMSVVSPMSLLTLGAVAASAALIQYLSSGSEVSKLDDRLKTHAANVSALRDAYGEALKGATTYAEQSNDVLRALAEASANALRTSLKAMTSDIAATLESNLGASYFEAAFAGYEEFESAIRALSEAAKAGEPGIVAFRQQIVAIASARPSDKFLQELRDRFLEMTNKADEAERAITGSNRAIAETARVASGAIAAVQGYRDAISDLAKISLPSLSPTQMADEAYARALEGATSPGARAAADAEYLAARTRIAEEEAKKQAEIDSRQAEQNAERMAREAQQQSDMLARRVEMIQQSLMTEQELETAAYEKRMEDLAAFYEGKTELDAEYREWTERAQEDHTQRMEEINRRLAEKEEQIRMGTWQATASLFGSLSQLAAQFGDKNLVAAKAFGIAEAVINTAVGITEALKLPPPLGWAQAAAVAAAGAAQIATIASARPNSARTPTVSGGGGYGGGYSAGGGPAVQTPKNDNALPNTAYLQITGKGTMTMDEVRELAEKIVDLQKDGFKLVVGS